MLFIPEVSATDFLFFIIPIVLAFFFYFKSAKTLIEKDKFILFVLSAICFSIWVMYLWKFMVNLANKLLYG